MFGVKGFVVMAETEERARELFTNVYCGKENLIFLEKDLNKTYQYLIESEIIEQDKTHIYDNRVREGVRYASLPLSMMAKYEGELTEGVFPTYQ